MAGTLTVYLHAGALSGELGQSTEVAGSISVSTNFHDWADQPYYSVSAFLHCNDEASLRALAAMCIKAADALPKAAAPESEAA